jgi:hypothetical protein
MNVLSVRKAVRTALGAACPLSLLLVPTLLATAEGQTLEKFASLPADSFAPGPTSGQFIAPANGRTPPFLNKQPVQGVSSVLPAGHGEFLVLSDNGFGAKTNSADYVLRVYRIHPSFRTRRGGSGEVEVESFFNLRDPDHKVNFPIVAEMDFYPNGLPPTIPVGTIPVDPQIKQKRLLTGADFDVESFRKAPDGTYWFGDEFGPFLLHTDASGRVLEAPIPLPGVQSPQNPFLGGATPNLPMSRGFEGMAISPSGKRLYPMLEGALVGDNPQRLLIYEFDLRKRAYTGRTWSYKLAVAGYSIGDLTAVTGRDFLVIERDQQQGAGAVFKKVFLVNLDDVDADGFLEKHEIVDLMNIADPDDVGGLATGVFTFPFVTIESVIPLDRRRIGVLNDNNYPGSSGRTPGESDNNEFIVVRLAERLPSHGHDHGHDDDDDPCHDDDHDLEGR